MLVWASWAPAGLAPPWGISEAGSQGPGGRSLEAARGVETAWGDTELTDRVRLGCRLPRGNWPAKLEEVVCGGPEGSGSGPQRGEARVVLPTHHHSEDPHLCFSCLQLWALEVLTPERLHSCQGMWPGSHWTTSYSFSSYWQETLTLMSRRRQNFLYTIISQWGGEATHGTHMIHISAPWYSLWMDTATPAWEGYDYIDWRKNAKNLQPQSWDLCIIW